MTTTILFAALSICALYFVIKYAIKAAMSQPSIFDDVMKVAFFLSLAILLLHAIL